MNEYVALALKALAGGLCVTIAALVSSVLKPKRFAGLFSAAPSVAIASLVVLAYSVGTANTRLAAESMIIGAVAMIAAVLLGLPILNRSTAARSTVFIAGFWIIVAGAGFAVLR